LKRSFFLFFLLSFSFGIPCLAQKQEQSHIDSLLAKLAMQYKFDKKHVTDSLQYAAQNQIKDINL